MNRASGWCPACGAELPNRTKWRGTSVCRRCLKQNRLEVRARRQRVDAARKQRQS